MTAKLSLIFPIGGTDVGEDFRGFETADGQSLIHRSLRSFQPFRERIGKVYYIVLEKHARRFDIARRLAAEVGDIDFELITLTSPTGGPAETVARGVAKHGIAGAAIVCDIDHRIDPAPLLHAMDALEPGCLVSLWPLAGEDLKRWSVACIAGNGTVVEVAERRLPAAAGFFRGVIGCYYFHDMQAVMAECLENSVTRFSGYFNRLAARRAPAQGVILEEAEFFGDGERIRLLEEGKPARGTIFCDIDGTLIQHEDRPDYSRLPRLLPGSREKLRQWIAEGYHVVLCTARRTEDEPRLVEMLRELALPYHRIVSGLPSGTRVVINDRKPHAMFTSQAASLEIARDQGIAAVEILPGRKLEVLRRFPGGSFAETLLMEESGRHFVRKRASKAGHAGIGYHRLRDQFRTLERFAQLAPGLVPALEGEENNSHEYFYDMEYLRHHRQLADWAAPAQAAALDRLFDEFGRHLYCQRSANTGAAEDWFRRHLAAKITPKIAALREHAILRPFLTGDGVEIDGVRHPSLEGLLEQLQREKVLARFTPQLLSLVHGDLTFQNVMLRGDGDIKVIDMEAQDSLEAIELDLGKVFQSLHSQYETWSQRRDPLCSFAAANRVRLNFTAAAPDAALLDAVRRRWASILGCSGDAVDVKGGFYLGLHLVRMVPFRLQTSIDHAAFALATGLKQINAAIGRAASKTARRAAA